MESFRTELDIKLSKSVYKWERSFLLDSMIVHIYYKMSYRERKSFSVGYKE